MSNNEKRFPLSLSAVVDQRGRQGKISTAMPQTAVKNAANNQQHTQGVRALGNRLAQDIPVPMKPVMPGVGMVSDKFRQAMVSRVAQQGVKDPLVLSALQAIQRHLFVESGLASQAYIDASLPIGHHQTISQPYIVARMAEILRNGKSLNKILEIGTGCGYQAAVLSLVAKEVYSIERIKALHELAKTNLRPMRIANIRLHYGDGMLGLPQVAPFDGIILAAAGLEVPNALLSQLTIGGRLIAPVGGRHQVLQLIERLGQHEWKSTVLEQCHFVPLHQGVI
ncbi:protein-L-isoaspartate(D-aspartate) O-methyltransferase [Undibacterium sp. Ji22W]|uniref:protein-L-isoaspartate(D-aspartate) O-methyltransferase n=1 Tax=Undibacterium sp. Ji22W TaxID=3413038 RepID=UPI003BF28F73